MTALVDLIIIFILTAVNFLFLLAKKLFGSSVVIAAIMFLFGCASAKSSELLMDYNQARGLIKSEETKETLIARCGAPEQRFMDDDSLYFFYSGIKDREVGMVLLTIDIDSGLIIDVDFVRSVEYGSNSD